MVWHDAGLSDDCPSRPGCNFQAQLLDAVGQAVIATDLEGTITYWNRAAERLYGWSEEEAIGRNSLDLTAAEGSMAQGKEIMERLVRGESWTGEFLVKRRDGSTFPAEVIDTPIFGEDGSLAGIVGISHDISLRKRAEAELLASETRYRTIVDTAHEGVWLVDVEGRTTFANARMAEMLGVTPDAMLGRPFFDFLHDEDRSAAAASFARRKQGDRDVYDVRFLHPDGSIRWGIISASPFLDDAGGFAGSLGMVTDITDRKRVEDELRLAKDKAEEMMRLKSSFLTNMSHEIRTPLTSIIGYADMLSHEIHGDLRALTESIRQGGERLLLTLDSVLALAQLESGSFRLDPRMIDVASEVREVLSMFRLRAVGSGLRLRMEPEGARVFAWVDRGALTRVLSNVVDNAIKFTRFGGVTVSLSVEDGSVCVEISDTGIGISEEFLSRLFIDFEQESQGLARTYEGVGLGLPIARRLVDMMGGTIHVSSTKGVGTSFTILLPADRRTIVPPGRRRARATRRADMPTVLVVEHEIDRWIDIKRRLRASFRATLAASLEEALLVADREHFDLVLVSVDPLHAEESTALASSLRSRAEYRSTPIIACASDDSVIVRGFDAKITAAFRPDALRALLPSTAD